MIDIEKVRKIIDNRTKIGTMSRDYGHHVDDILHIEDPYELTVIDNAIEELETLRKKDTPLEPLVSIVYENNKKQIRANCKICGAMIYQTCDLLPLKEALNGERPYCQHCGQRQSADINLNENHYCNSI